MPEIPLPCWEVLHPAEHQSSYLVPQQKQEQLLGLLAGGTTADESRGRTLEVKQTGLSGSCRLHRALAALWGLQDTLTGRAQGPVYTHSRGMAELSDSVNHYAGLLSLHHEKKAAVQRNEPNAALAPGARRREESTALGTANMN
ncbi:hypothetical protein NDU88_005580 [Pleurodeles waltl]|uniref:Uncharacterized protein n=1 Tax=Pleurodeles waltl TaxID=8319 RepID=A0AAV7N1P1_PLEWA|nr:hypothetical protein NDU88_005580 [Pleurodeles waltl]